MEEVTALQDLFRAAMITEEMFWHQKNRVIWLEAGDKNTKFFHASTKQRRARNRIIGILDEGGNGRRKRMKLNELR